MTTAIEYFTRLAKSELSRPAISKPTKRLIADKVLEEGRVNVERNISLAATYFNEITGNNLSAHDVWLLLEIIKDTRKWNKSEYPVCYEMYAIEGYPELSASLIYGWPQSPSSLLKNADAIAYCDREIADDLRFLASISQILCDEEPVPPVVTVTEL